MVIGSKGKVPSVVMDILNFKDMTAEQSIAHAKFESPNPEYRGVNNNWCKFYSFWIDNFVPLLKERRHVEKITLMGEAGVF